ncbi:hypothetical protein JCM3766R1_004219 [Sporobolomyces carnicolor]
MSTSDAASTKTGACVVCGKETTQVCSQCKRSGIDCMYFCGVEHQRLGRSNALSLQLHSATLDRSVFDLVWNLHKRVCGKNPFRFPALSRAEANEIYEMRHHRTDWPIDDSGPRYLLQSCIDRFVGASGISDEVIFEAMLTMAMGTSDVSPCEKATAIIRSSAFYARLNECGMNVPCFPDIPRGKIRVTSLTDPIGCLLVVIGIDTGALFAGVDWMPMFLHRLTLFIARIKQIDADLAARGPERFVSDDEKVSLSHMMTACTDFDSSSTSNMTPHEREWYDRVVKRLTYYCGIELVPSELNDVASQVSTERAV